MIRIGSDFRRISKIRKDEKYRSIWKDLENKVRFRKNKNEIKLG